MCERICATLCTSVCVKVCVCACVCGRPTDRERVDVKRWRVKKKKSNRKGREAEREAVDARKREGMVKVLGDHGLHNSEFDNPI